MKEKNEEEEKLQKNKKTLKKKKWEKYLKKEKEIEIAFASPRSSSSVFA